jgi:hypothetical protein
LLDFNIDGIIYDMIWLDSFLNGTDEYPNPDDYVYNRFLYNKNPVKGDFDYEHRS